LPTTLIASTRQLFVTKWIKRQEQSERMMGVTAGIYKDLQWIAGKSLREIEGLELSGIGSNLS
jgi:hypothetical protein